VVGLLVRTVAPEVLEAWMGRGIPSRMMEMERTTMRGTQAVADPRGLMAGMVWRMAMRRKKTLARR
jgi:hypothetical protein